MTDQYTRLLEWRRAEASSRGLAKLPHDFYATTRTYLAEARRLFESELRANPSGKKGELARQTYQRAGQVARDVVEARMTKVLSLAFQASVGGAKDLPNALPEERSLFDGLLDRLRAHRQGVAPFLEPSAEGAGTPALLADASPPAEPAPLPSAPAATPATVLVRIVKDGRPVVVGGDTVELRKEDLLTLPAETARLLIDAKLAEPVRPKEPPATA